MKRHKDKLTIRKLQGLDYQRVEGRRTMHVLEYFVFYRDLLIKHKFRHDRIFNCDETPCQLANIPRKGVVPKELNEAHFASSSNRLVLTMFPCVSATGDCIPPLVTYQGKSIDSGFFDFDFDFVLSTNKKHIWSKMCLKNGVFIL